MVPLLRPARPAPVRSVEEAAELAALTQFRLLQMLSSDRRALATARLLGVPLRGAGQLQQVAAVVPPPGPPPADGAANGGAVPKKRRPRKLSEARRRVLEERPRAQAHRQKRMHTKFLQVIPLVSSYVRLGPFVERAMPMDADATSAGATSAASAGAAAAMMPSPPLPPPSPPPQWSPSWAAAASLSASPLTPQARGARDREPSQDRSRTPSDGSPGSGHGGEPAPRDTG